jgi:hypothetical protein
MNKLNDSRNRSTNEEKYGEIGVQIRRNRSSN